jgi:hypothetical protein
MKRTHIVFSFIAVVVLVMAAFPAGGAFAAGVGPLASAVKVTPNPAAVNTTVTLTATVDASAVPTAIIQSVEYSVDGGAWTPMTASDGTFDTAVEDVTASFSATPIGTYDVCVRATDSLANVGDPVCTPLTVQSLYSFKGFGSPIKMNKVNKANAPQTIPVKWTLTLTGGGIVKDPASFVALKSYLVDCTTLTGDISTAVVEKGPGKTKLNNLGGGSWQFNWKTPKTYRGTCRAMFVLFSDGLMSPQVPFKFK